MKLSKKGYQYDHGGFIHKQVILEKYGLKKIPPNRVIHHKDGNKQNNSPENLILIPTKVHNKHTAFLRIIKKWDEYYLRMKEKNEKEKN